MTLTLVGCDDRSADKDVRAAMEEGHALALGGSEEALASAKAKLEQAAGNAEASPAVQANAKALLAQVELEAARAAQRTVDRKMMDVSRLVADVSQLAQQIGTTNALVAGYRQYDPREPLAAIEQSVADATGGPDKAAWFTHENTTLPTLFVLKQEISRLEGELAALQEKLNQLNAQRSTVLTESDAASRASEGPRNDETLAAFKRASELRKQAADLATEIEATTAAMLPLRNDLAVAQSQQQVIDTFISENQNRAEALATGWQMIQQQMAAQNSLSKAILQGSGFSASGSASDAPVLAGGAISDKAAELSKVTAEIKAAREQALDNASNAADHYGQAVTLAEQLRQKLSTDIGDPKNQSRPERKSWEAMREVMHPATFRLHQAAAQRALATIHGSAANELSMRVELRNLMNPILEAASLAIPDELQAPNLERDREQALTAANEAYQAADELLQNIIDGQAQPDVQNAAYVARILTLYGWSQLARENGDAKAAEERLDLAVQVKSGATERNIALPALPEGLGPTTPATPATEPATAPAAEPTADPAAADPAAPAPADAPTEPPADTPAEPPSEPPAGGAASPG